MKITEIQLQVMLRALEGTLRIHDTSDFKNFGFSQKDRQQVYLDVINQQQDLVRIEKSLTPNSDYEKSCEALAMSIVNRINENVGTCAAIRQSTNDVNIDETVIKLKKLLNDFT